MPGMDDLSRAQAQLGRDALALSREKDPERVLDGAQRLCERGEALQRAARALEASYEVPQGAETRVKLTAEQQRRVAEATGAAVEMVTVRGEPGQTWSRRMEKVSPQEIERIALRQAGQ